MSPALGRMAAWMSPNGCWNPIRPCGGKRCATSPTLNRTSWPPSAPGSPGEGMGARLLELQDEDGHWAGAEWDNDRKSVYWTLHTLRRFGADPDAAPVRAAIQKVHENVVWKYWDDRSYFGGEVEPCINGGVLAQGAYFGVLGEGSDRLIGLLLAEQLEEGGWNCDAPESTRSSFDSTLNVLEGLLEYERAVGSGAVPEVAEARRRGEEFLLERGLFRRLTTGEIAQPRYRNFSFPPYWFYDVLRSLDYFRSTGAAPDSRVADAVDLVRARRTDRRPLALRGHLAGRGVVRHRRARGRAEPMEHAARAPGAALVRGRRVRLEPTPPRSGPAEPAEPAWSRRRRGRPRRPCPPSTRAGRRDPAPAARHRR